MFGLVTKAYLGRGGHCAVSSRPVFRFGRIFGRNLGEDLFFFALHLVLGEKSDQNLSENLLFLFFALHLSLGEKSD